MIEKKLLVRLWGFMPLCLFELKGLEDSYLIEKQVNKYTIHDRVDYIQACLAYKKYSKKQIEDILRFDQEFIQRLLLAGECITMPYFGSFRLRYIAPREEYEGINPYTQERMMIPAHDEYNRIQFHTYPGFKKELKDKFYGNAVKPMFQPNDEEELPDGEEIESE